MDLRTDDGRTIFREPFSHSEQFVMRVWVNDKFEINSKAILVEFVDFIMDPADPEAGFTAHPVVRWDGELINVPLVADDKAFWLSDPETLRGDIRSLKRSWERYIEEPLRDACTFIAYVMGETYEEGE